MNWKTFVNDIYRRFGISLSEKEAARIKEKMMGVMDKEMADAPLYKDVHKTIKQLKKDGYKIIIASYAPEERIRQKLMEENLLDYVDGIFGRQVSTNRIERTKHVINHLSGLGINPEECLLVGDMPDDVLASRKVGAISAVILRKRFGKTIVPKPLFKKRNLEPDYYIKSLSELKKLLTIS